MEPRMVDATEEKKELGKCKNCDEEVYATFRQHPYCKACFPQTCLHLFRAAFGKHNVVRDGERVLVAFSGGAASAAMVHLVRLGLADGAARKLRFTPFVFHLDEGELAASPQPEEDRAAVAAFLADCGFEHAVLTWRETLPDDAALLAVVAARGEATARQSLLRVLRRRCLLAAARRFRCSRVLLGESGTRAAGLALESVLEGRGAEVADGGVFADGRFSPTLVRPLLEFAAAECLALARLCGPSGVAEGRGPLARAMAMGSLQGLTARTLRDLEPGFPATNFAVLRTAGKMRAGDPEAPRCRLCEAPGDLPDPDADGASAADDLRFAHARVPGREALSDPALCYGCHILAQKLPPLRDWLVEGR